MNAAQRDELKKFFKALEDRPLEPYETIYEVRLHQFGSISDPIEDLVSKIDWSDTATVNLVSGQRGAGKSTELRRLRQRLQQIDCTVFLIDMADYINLARPLDITDFLIALMGALSDAAKAQFGQDFQKESYWDRFAGFAKSQVKLELGFKTGIELKAGLKSDPGFKDRLQKAVSGHLGKLVRDAHAFAEEIVAFVRRKTAQPERRVVLLVDSVEKIRGVGEEASKVHASVENLFNVHGQHLHMDPLHLVYTIPPYLTPLAPGISRHLGGSPVCNLANAHVFHRSGGSDKGGLRIMRDLIGKRYAPWSSILREDQLNRLILASGGDLRDCFRLLQQVLISARTSAEELPVDDTFINHAENLLRRDMLPIAERDRTWLRRIHETKDSGLAGIEELHRLAHFFDANLVQSYRNDQDWYDVHPLLRQIVLETREEQNE